jgi:DNA-binding transcriptional LysR family regulator
MLDLHRARILREVARLGSMTAAAQALSYTQPAISHHIARLEAEAGTPLVVRHGRGVRLTEAGRILVEHVEDVLARMADAEERLAAIAGLRAGRVRVAVFPTAAAALLPDALAELRARAPGVTVSLEETEPPQAVAAVRAGEADLAVVFAYPHTPPDTDARLRQVPLFDDPIRLVLPGGHALADADEVDLADLAEETWASGCERCRGHLIRACEQAGFTRLRAAGRTGRRRRRPDAATVRYTGRHGPVMANVVPGWYTLTNIVRPSGEKVTPANSPHAGSASVPMFCRLRANGYTWRLRVTPKTCWAPSPSSHTISPP